MAAFVGSKGVAPEFSCAGKGRESFAIAVSRQVQVEKVAGSVAEAFRSEPGCPGTLCCQSPLLILERLSLALPSGSAEPQVMATQIRDGGGAHQLHVPY